MNGEQVPDTGAPQQHVRRNVTIKSASFNKGIFLKGDYTEVMGKNGEQIHKFSSTVPVHDDLRITMRDLRMDCISLAEVFDKNGPVNEDKITVLGFTIGGEAEQEGVTISFIRTLDNGKEVNINTPFQKWDDQTNPYANASELSLKIEAVRAEVYEYLFEDKHQPTNQLEIGFPEDEV